jgi:hypothetical protein
MLSQGEERQRFKDQEVQDHSRGLSYVTHRHVFKIFGFFSDCFYKPVLKKWRNSTLQYKFEGRFGISQMVRKKACAALWRIFPSNKRVSANRKRDCIGDIVDSGIGCRTGPPTYVASGRYNPMPVLTISPQSGTKNLATEE